MLRRMGMFCTAVYKQLLKHFTTEPVFGKHPLYRFFYNGLRAADHQGLRINGFLPAGISGKTEVFLVFQLIPRKLYLFCISNDDKITAVNMWRVIGLILTFKNGSYFSAHTSNGLIGTVHNIPVVGNGSRIRMLCSEM